MEKAVLNQLDTYSNPSISNILDNFLLMTIINTKGTILYASEGICEISGYTKKELIGKNQKLFSNFSNHDNRIDQILKSLTERKQWIGEVENFTKLGHSFWVKVTIEPIYDSFGKKSGYIVLKQNITDKKQNELLSKTDPLTNLYNRRHLDVVFETELNKAKHLNSTIGFMIIDIDFFKNYNDHYGHLLGDEALKNVAHVLQDIAKNYSGFAFRLGGEEFGVLFAHISIDSLDNILNQIHQKIKKLNISHGKSTICKKLTVSVGAVLSDLNQKISTKECQKNLYLKADLLLYQSKNEGRNRSRISYLKKTKPIDTCEIDEVTKLPMRDDLHVMIQRSDKEMMLILIQINHFDYIQNQYGQEGYHAILIEKIKVFRNIMSQGDNTYLFRLNINEFAILVMDQYLFEPYMLKSEYYILGETFTTVDKKQDEKIVVSQTIAIASGRDNLLGKADLALKRANKNNESFSLYDTNLDKKSSDKKLYFKEIALYKKALEDNRIIPYFQPIVHAKSRKIFKYEALARIIDEDGKIHLPNAFIEIAKEDRTLQYFTRQLLQKIFNIYSHNNQIGISINLSHASISSEEILFYLKNRLDLFGGENITFEVTEVEKIKNYQNLTDFANLVKNYGASIAIDDFGAEYSNFTQFMKLSPDFLKINGAIIENIHTDTRMENAIESLLLYAQKTDGKLIAKHVSDEKIATKAEQVGIEFLQGFYCGKPKPPNFYGLAN